MMMTKHKQGYGGKQYAMLLFTLIFAFLQTPLMAEPMLIAFSEFKRGDGAGDSLGFLIPGHLRNELAKHFELSSIRHTGTEEYLAYSSKQNLIEEEGLRKAVSSAKTERDIKAVSLRMFGRQQLELKQSEKKVGEAKKKLDSFLSGNMAAEDLYENMIIRELKLYQSHQGLLPYWNRDERQSKARQEKIDFLVYGEVRLAANIYVVSVSLYSTFMDADIWEYENYASENSFQEMLDEISKALTIAVSGKAYSRLKFFTDPPGSRLEINGLPYNSKSAIFFEPVSLHLRFEARGYKTEEIRTAVLPGDEKDITVKLEALKGVDLKLDSEPEGAAVYLDGLLMGQTPLVLAGITQAGLLRLSLDNYESMQLVLNGNSGPMQKKIRLDKKESSSFDERYEVKKSAFYKALGLFVLSLPATVLSAGLFQTQYYTLYGAAQDYSHNTTYSSLETSFYFYQAAFWVSSALTLAGAVNAGIKLAKYISFAQ